VTPSDVSSTHADPASDPGDAPRPGGSTGGRLAAVALPLVVIAALLWLGWSHRFTTDDAFINFRVVKQIQAGNGPVFNIGERVEVTTSTAWLGVLLAADVVSPFRLEWNALAAELVLSAVGLAAAMAGAVRLADLGRPDPRTNRWVVPVGAVAYLAPFAAWEWATGGLENGLGIAWIGTAFWGVVGLISCPRPSRLRLLAVAALVGGGVLVRPDFVVLVLGLAVPVGVVAWRRARVRGLAAAAAVALALPVAVQVFRMGYYAELLPNTAYAKEGTRAWWDQGWRYLRDFAGSYALVVPVALVLAWLVTTRRADEGPGRRDRWLVIGAVEAAALAYAFAITRGGGDYMHARLLMPAWFCLLSPLAALPLADLPRPRNLAISLGLVAWAVVAAVAFRPQPGSLVPPRAADQLDPDNPIAAIPATGVMDARFSSVTGAGGEAHPVLVTAFPAPRLMPAGPDGPTAWFEPATYPPASGTEMLVRQEVGHTVFSTFPVGAFGYAAPLDVYVYDRLGLTEPLTAHLRLDWRGAPGHEKTLSPPWIAARFLAGDATVTDPDFMALGPTPLVFAGVDVPATVPPGSFAGQRADAEDALACDDLARFLDGVREPLTPGRFVRNIADSFRNDRLRVPADPGEARRQLC
jgi:arabinofuranosyltransferase